jgi:hypothetical protein
LVLNPLADLDLEMLLAQFGDALGVGVALAVLAGDSRAKLRSARRYRTGGCHRAPMITGAIAADQPR